METTSIITLDTYQMFEMLNALQSMHNDRTLYNRKIIAQFVYDKHGNLNKTFYDINTGDVLHEL